MTEFAREKNIQRVNLYKSSTNYRLYPKSTETLERMEAREADLRVKILNTIDIFRNSHKNISIASIAKHIGVRRDKITYNPDLKKIIIDAKIKAKFEEEESILRRIDIYFRNVMPNINTTTIKGIEKFLGIPRWRLRLFARIKPILDAVRERDFSSEIFLSYIQNSE